MHAYPNGTMKKLSSPCLALYPIRFGIIKLLKQLKQTKMPKTAYSSKSGSYKTSSEPSR